jgi:hypothetical protein
MVKTAMNNTIENKIELLDRGMKCLTDTLGVLDAERFIAFVNSEQFDYTQWQRKHFDNMTADEIDKEMLEYISANPYEGDPATIV